MDATLTKPLPPLPPIVRRPKWAVFLYERALVIDQVAPIIGVSREYVRQLGLPYDHPQWRKPKPREIELIESWTGGLITAEDWERPADLDLK